MPFTPVYDNGFDVATAKMPYLQKVSPVTAGSPAGDTLLKCAEGILLQHAEASSVNVLLDNGCGQYGTVNENDPALVSLRTDHTRVDLHALQTTISGECAYPMVARGRVVAHLCSALNARKNHTRRMNRRLSRSSRTALRAP